MYIYQAHYSWHSLAVQNHYCSSHSPFICSQSYSSCLYGALHICSHLNWHIELIYILIIYLKVPCCKQQGQRTHLRVRPSGQAFTALLHWSRKSNITHNSFSMFVDVFPSLGHINNIVSHPRPHTIFTDNKLSAHSPAAYSNFIANRIR